MPLVEASLTSGPDTPSDKVAATEATPLKLDEISAHDKVMNEHWAKLRMAHATGARFKSLLKRPNRPPLPGSATPPGYVIHKRPAPADATWTDKLRDVILDYATHWIIAALMIAWLLLLAADAVIFFGTLFYWFGWGVATDEGFGCTATTPMPTPKFQCDPETGVLTYSVEDYWQAASAAWMSWLFLYVVLLALPWRLSILFQLWEPRCTEDGVDFYGRPSEFNFFHFPRQARWIIASLLMLNVICQIMQSILYIYPWGLQDVPAMVSYFTQPNATVLLLTGPLQGCIFGGAAAGVQMYHESKLHVADPKRFPPTVLDTISDVNKLRKEGHTWADIFASLKEG